ARRIVQLLQKGAAQVGLDRAMVGFDRAVTADGVDVIDPPILRITKEHRVIHMAEHVHLAPFDAYRHKTCEVCTYRLSHRQYSCYLHRNGITAPALGNTLGLAHYIRTHSRTL